MRRAGEYDPVRAMQFAEEYAATVETYGQDMEAYSDEEFILKDQGDLLSGAVAWNALYYAQNRIFPEFLSRNYPSAFYESGADCPLVLSGVDSGQASSRYTVSLSGNDGFI